MKHKLTAYITKILGENPPNLDSVLGRFKEITTSRNEIILREGEVCKYVYFIVSGCLQVFVYDNQANETTRDLVVENNWCSELMSFGSGNPATENIRCAEPCQLLAIDKAGFQEMMQSVPQYGMVYQKILEASYANSVYRINTFVSLSALDRIKWLMDNRPGLMARLPSKLIASYLGISQETFSRLKAKL